MCFEVDVSCSCLFGRWYCSPVGHPLQMVSEIKIAAVDDDGAEKALLERVRKFFEKHNIANVPALASLSQTVLESSEGWPTDLERESFLRRCDQVAAKASVVKAQNPLTALSSGQSGGLSSQARRHSTFPSRATKSLPKRSWKGLHRKELLAQANLADLRHSLVTRPCSVRGVGGGKACGKSGSSSLLAVPLRGLHSEGVLAGLDDTRHDRG